VTHLVFVLGTAWSLGKRLVQLQKQQEEKQSSRPHTSEKTMLKLNSCIEEHLPASFSSFNSKLFELVTVPLGVLWPQRCPAMEEHDGIGIGCCHSHDTVPASRDTCQLMEDFSPTPNILP